MSLHKQRNLLIGAKLTMKKRHYLIFLNNFGFNVAIFGGDSSYKWTTCLTNISYFTRDPFLLILPTFFNISWHTL
jgi:hypothetical protein